jgi:hypothetical protein
MGHWIICENAHNGEMHRQVELYYAEQPGAKPIKRTILLWPDGRLEVGVKESPFRRQYGENVGECK